MERGWDYSEGFYVLGVDQIGIHGVHSPDHRGRTPATSTPTLDGEGRGGEVAEGREGVLREGGDLGRRGWTGPW